MPAVHRVTLLRLAKHAESLDLDGYRDLDVWSARRLGGFCGFELLLYLDSLPAEVAVQLARAQVELLSISVTRMGPAAARVLARGRHRAGELQVFVAGGLDVALASELTGYRGDCLTIGCDRLQPDTARELARYGGRLQLHVAEVDEFAARALAASTGWLELVVRGSFPSSAAREMANARCRRLEIWHLADLDPSVAGILARARAGTVELNSLKDQSDRICQAAPSTSGGAA